MNVIFHIDEEKRWPLVQGNVTHMLVYCEQLQQDFHIEIVVNGRAVRQLKEEAAEFGAFIADQGAEQCGFCNPGFIMNALALFRENPDPGEDEIKEYLAGNLCRCSGYEGQLRGILNFLAWKKGKEAAQ